MMKYFIGRLWNIFHPGLSMFCMIDENSIVSRYARVYRFSKILDSNINDYTYITPGCDIVHSDIGKFCSIGQGAKIGLAHHHLHFISTSPIFTSRLNALRISWTQAEDKSAYSRVHIGNDVWIGADCKILGGVRIEDGAVIAAGAVVTKNIPAYAIVAGVPARIVRYRFKEDVIIKLLNLKWWNLSPHFLKSKAHIFMDENFEYQIEILKAECSMVEMLSED